MSVFIPRGKTITDFVFVLVSAVLTFDGGDGQKFLGLFFGFTFLLGSLALLGHSLWQGNGLVVQGSQQNFLLELSSYASANFGPLAGIDGKTLCLRFRYKKSEHDALNGKPHRPYFRSFRLSPGLPVAIDGVKLRIEIVKSTGLNELTVPGEEIAASQTKLIAAEEYLKTSDMNSDNNEVELVIPHGSKANYLRIVNPSEEGVSLRVTVCEVTDLSRIRTRNPAVFPRLEAVVQRVRRQSAIRR